MSDTAQTPEPPSTIVECIPAVRLETGELLTTAEEHAAHAKSVEARRAPDPAATAETPAIVDVTTEDPIHD